MMPVLEQPSLSAPREMLRQFCRGDLDAFEALFRQHQGEVYGWIVRIVRDPAAAEDLTIETFWRIHRAHVSIPSAASRRGHGASPLTPRSITCERRGITPSFPTTWRHRRSRTTISPTTCAGKRRAPSSGFQRSSKSRPRWR
jgi:hypothetical protein